MQSSQPGKATFEQIRRAKWVDLTLPRKIPKNIFVGINAAEDDVVVSSQYVLFRRLCRGDKPPPGLTWATARLIADCRPYGMFIVGRKMCCGRKAICPSCHARQVDAWFERLQPYTGIGASLNVAAFSTAPLAKNKTRTLRILNTALKNIRRRLGGVTLLCRLPGFTEDYKPIARVVIVNIADKTDTPPPFVDYKIPSYWRTVDATEENLQLYMEKLITYETRVLDKRLPGSSLAKYINLESDLRSRIIGE